MNRVEITVDRDEDERKEIAVQWLDSSQTHGWRVPDDEEFGLVKVTSYGVLLKDEDEFIVIAPHYGAKDDRIGAPEQACGMMTIPKRAIIGVYTIRTEWDTTILQGVELKT